MNVGRIEVKPSLEPQLMISSLHSPEREGDATYAQSMTSQCQTVEHGTFSISPDGPTFAFALHHPTQADHRAALIAHPYGRLGGCKEDHVVVALAEKLASAGWRVLRYDARGAGASTGSVSWT